MLHGEQSLQVASVIRASGECERMTTKAQLIVGCGYIGSRLLRELIRGPDKIFVTSRVARRYEGAAGSGRVNSIRFDTADEQLSLPGSFPGVDEVDVYCLLTPAALASGEARSRLLGWLATLPVRRAILASSTGIYGERAGGVVTAETELRPTEPRAQRLQDIEADWRRRRGWGVVRFAGLYGPKRVIGRQTLMAGETLPGQPAALLNLLHRDDAVALLVACMCATNAPAVEVGSDGTPVTRADYYETLARLLGTAPPRFQAAANEGERGKAVDPRSTMRRLEWSPRYTDFRDGLATALKASPEE